MFGIGLIVVSTIAVAIVPSLAKLAYDGGSNTLSVITGRSIVSVVITLALLLVLRRPLVIPRTPLMIGLLMGVGYALTEELLYDHGRLLNPNFRDYKLLTALDSLPVEPVIVELPDAAGPYGAKGIGEPGLVPTAPAIANAIYDAVGVRLRRLPMTPERVLAPLFAKEGRPIE